MTKQQIKQEFIKFLKEQDALIDFVCILANKKYKTLNVKGIRYTSISLSDYLTKCPQAQYILAFTTWANINEHNAWSKWELLHDMWNAKYYWLQSQSL